MTFITVSDEQARLIAEASSPIVVMDPRGREIARLSPMGACSQPDYTISDEELAELKDSANSPDPGKTTQELLAHLQSIAPIEDEGVHRYLASESRTKLDENLA